MSIRKKLLLSIICIVIIPLFIVPIITYYQYKSILEEKINISAQQTLKQVSNNVENVIENMIASTNTLCLDGELLNILKKGNSKDKWQKYVNDKKVYQKITAAQSAVLYPYNSNVAIIGFHGNMYSSYSFPIFKSYKDVSNEAWFKKTVSMNGYMYWMAPAIRYMNFSDRSDNRNIVMSRLIKDESGTKNYGVIVISIGPDMQLGNLFSVDTKFEKSSLILTDKYGNLILGNGTDNNQSEAGKLLKNSNIVNEDSGSFVINVNNEKSVVNFYTIPKAGWKLIQIIPYSELTKEMEKLRIFNLGINMIFLIIIILIAYLAAYGITKPLGKLNILMKKVTEGDFNIRAEIKGRDEIASLANSFNIMVKEIDNLIDELKIAYETRSKIRLEALQAQINPHFLLNTLNGIKWIVTMKGDTESSKMMSDLGYLLENTIGRNEEMIKLSEELKCLESYVSIQKMRYGDRFSLHYEIEEEFMNYKVPCLFLQPLIENCIIHGLEDKETGGLINITAYKEDMQLKLRISDNGKGMTENELITMREGLNEHKGRFTNIGVKNVEERIKLIYGKEFGINIDSELGIGTTVEILLPLNYQGGAAC